MPDITINQMLNCLGNAKTATERILQLECENALLLDKLADAVQENAKLTQHVKQCEGEVEFYHECCQAKGKENATLREKLKK